MGGIDDSFFIVVWTHSCHVQGCMNVAGFIEQYQAAKIRDEQWSKIPSVSWVDRDNGSVRGWATINQEGGVKPLV